MPISEVVLHQGVQDWLSLPPGSIPEMVRMLSPGRSWQTKDPGSVLQEHQLSLEPGGSGTDRSPGREEVAPAKEETGSSCEDTGREVLSLEEARGPVPWPGRRVVRAAWWGAVMAARCPSKWETARQEEEGCSEGGGGPQPAIFTVSSRPAGTRYHCSHLSWTTLRLEGEEDALLTHILELLQNEITQGPEDQPTGRTIPQCVQTWPSPAHPAHSLSSS